MTIEARIALQNIWRSKHYDLDDLLSDHMVELWRNLFRNVQSLEAIQLPWCLQSQSTVSGLFKLHVFADASGSAYDRVAYLLRPTVEGPEVRLVSPIGESGPSSTAYHPRPELIAALSVSRLVKTIYNEFKIKPSSVMLWSNSKIVVHWLRSESALLNLLSGLVWQRFSPPETQISGGLFRQSRT